MSSRVPSPIPDLDDDQFLPFGDDDDFDMGVRSSDGNLVIRANNNIVITPSGGLTVPGDLTVSGTTTEVVDVVTTDITVEDSGDTAQFVIDGDATTPFLDLKQNEVRNLDTAGALLLPDNPGASTIFDFTVTSTPGAGTEESYIIGIDGNTILKVYAEADGAGGIQNNQIRFPDGSLSNPGIAFENDPNTGLHRPGVDIIQIVTDGDAEAEVTSAGDLNIEGTLTESTTV